MKRKTLSAKIRLQIFQTHKGLCHICGGKVNVGESWDVEHVIPFAMGGEDNETNWAVAHVKCHRTKTVQDVAEIAKAKRREARHRGSHQSRTPLPFGKKSKLKKKMDGTIVRRNEE